MEMEEYRLHAKLQLLYKSHFRNPMELEMSQNLLAAK